MKHSLILIVLSVLASASIASAADSLIRVQDNQLAITSSDGKTTLRCDSFTLLRTGKSIATFSVVGGMVQLKGGDFTIQAAELHLQDAEGTVCQAVDNGKLTVTKSAATTGPAH
jgi:hypothetical protein